MSKKPVAKPAPAVAPVVETQPIVEAAPVVTSAPVVEAEVAPVVIAAKVEAPKVEAPKAEAPKAPAKKAAPVAAANPALELIKPFTALQEQFRLQTEKGNEQIRANYASMKGNAEAATAKLEESLVAARTGAKALAEKVFEVVQAQTKTSFEHAKALGSAKTVEEVAKLQQAFLVSQFEAFKSQATDFAAFTTKIANDVSEPAKASFVAALKR